MGIEAERAEDAAGDACVQRKPNVRVAYKPVTPQKANDAGVPKSANPYLRAANEDDDGYDPYSDRREEEPLFEARPWD